MSLHRVRLHSDAEADWRPHPLAVVAYVAGVAWLAWSVVVYAQMPNGQGGAGPRAEPWRPATSKWSRAPTGGQQSAALASKPAYAALPAVSLTPPSRSTPLTPLTPRAPQAPE